jgi:hypothetical protein
MHTLGAERVVRGITIMIGRNYFTQQVAILLKFAQTTSDRKIAAGLVDKAVALKERIEETPSPSNLDLRARAPDLKT